jgi:hypothetical protein
MKMAAPAATPTALTPLLIHLIFGSERFSVTYLMLKLVTADGSPRMAF